MAVLARVEAGCTTPICSTCHAVWVGMLLAVLAGMHEEADLRCDQMALGMLDLGVVVEEAHFDMLDHDQVRLLRCLAKFLDLVAGSNSDIEEMRELSLDSENRKDSLIAIDAAEQESHSW
jgi:hypothetical protein